MKEQGYSHFNQIEPEDFFHTGSVFCSISLERLALENTKRDKNSNLLIKPRMF